ncbi:hypothetical protein AUK22_07795 [bacterium CG2_30_54_10]|nr:MAG: hypothetical protein AUK22_07795 [bacterium CG2_30_54_10]
MTTRRGNIIPCRLSRQGDVEPLVLRSFDSFILFMARGSRMTGKPWPEPKISRRGVQRRAGRFS